MAKWNVIKSENVRLPSGFIITVDRRKEEESGKEGVNLSTKKFFFPISWQDVDTLADALKRFAKP